MLLLRDLYVHAEPVENTVRSETSTGETSGIVRVYAVTKTYTPPQAPSLQFRRSRSQRYGSPLTSDGE
jgi:hypothetical protein